MDNKFFYSKLAINNIRKNEKTYIPYILTCILSVAMFYIVYSLSGNKGLDQMIGAQTIRFFLQMGVGIVAIFLFVFLFYIHSFLLKRRTKEFGLFNILGMEKRHILKIVALESLYIGIFSLVTGLIVGILLDKVMFLCIGRIFKANVSLGFYISHDSLIATTLLFIFIFCAILLKTGRIIQLSHPIELLRDAHAGEKEPKSKWLLTVIGLIALTIGYFISVTTKEPLSAISLFFVAVLLVIIGTYCLFTAGSITFLKFLKQRKNFYYQTEHFVSISGMIYRMKQNAVGLANICVLCTMVLVMLSSTLSLWMGINDLLDVRYPHEILIAGNPETETLSQIETLTDEVMLRYQAHKTDEFQYTYLLFAGLRNADSYSTDVSEASLASVGQIENLFFMTADEYENIMHEHIDLKDHEIMLYTNRGQYDFDVLKVLGEEFKIVKKMDQFVGNGILASRITTSQFIVVKDQVQLDAINQKQKEAYGDNASELSWYYAFDTDQDEENNCLIYKELEQSFVNHHLRVDMECRSVEQYAAIGLYAGLLFLGIFLSVLFIMATILIIYYKQISEGYDDKERFVIMQKVGMSHKFVKKSIHSQVMTVFLLPPIVAGIHIIFAFPFIYKILQIFGLMNLKLYALCTLVCFLAFLIVYAMIYVFTAKTYYKIVKWENS